MEKLLLSMLLHKQFEFTTTVLGMQSNTWVDKPSPWHFYPTAGMISLQIHRTFIMHTPSILSHVVPSLPVHCLIKVGIEMTQ